MTGISVRWLENAIRFPLQPRSGRLKATSPNSSRFLAWTSRPIRSRHWATR